MTESMIIAYIFALSESIYWFMFNPYACTFTLKLQSYRIFLV